MVSVRVKFDDRDMRNINRRFMRAPTVLGRNLDRAQRSTAFAISRDAIINITSNGLDGFTAVDRGDLKRSIIIKDINVVGTVQVGSNLRHARWTEFGTGLWVTAPQSRGTFESNVDKPTPKAITPKRAKMLRYEIRTTRRIKRQKVHPRAKKFRKFAKPVGGGRVIIFAEGVSGLKPRLWLTRAALANRARHKMLTQKALAASATAIAEGR